MQRFHFQAPYIQTLSSASLSGTALLLPNLLRNELGADTVLIGFITASFNAALFFSSYYFGRYSDVHGRRLVLQAGLLLTAFSIALLAFANSSTAIWVVRIMIGLAAGMYPSALLAHVYESDKKVGKFSAYGSLGFGVGTFMAGFIGIYFEIFIFSAVLMFGAYLISLMIPFGNEAHQKVPLFPKAIIVRNFPVYLSIMLRHVGANMIWVIYPLFLEDLGASPWMIGVFYGINALAQFVFMSIVDRFKAVPLVITGFIFSIITFPSYTLATEAWQIIPAQITIAAAWSSLYVGCVKYIMERNDEKGTSAGLLQSSLSIAAIIGALVGGTTAFTLGYHGTMYLATTIAILGLVSFVLSSRWMAKRDGKEIKTT